MALTISTSDLIIAPVAASSPAVPAISKCTHLTPFSTKAFKKHAAVDEPASHLPLEFLISALFESRYFKKSSSRGNLQPFSSASFIAFSTTL